ncbi:hypothetical protein Pmani_021386 [Petrolisthes manimaculis]|uniref:Uncharacterized protein n=1 Tax=Petrolisthes manimaculis TaxID=1843537 RepID=A0AAE1U5C3_9EUCA|nr:hypothetical protein Pmani_021386 [Petrolisthes manimaculis]
MPPSPPPPLPPTQQAGRQGRLYSGGILPTQGWRQDNATPPPSYTGLTIQHFIYVQCSKENEGIVSGCLLREMPAAYLVSVLLLAPIFTSARVPWPVHVLVDLVGVWGGGRRVWRSSRKSTLSNGKPRTPGRV